MIAAVLFFGAQLLLQVANHSFSSEFARTYDEAAHFVTGLMVRDFIVGLDWSSPMAYAEDYYLHYPKVALGHWPPGFYLIQAGWTLVFSTSRFSLMLLMATLTTVLAGTIALILRRETDTVTACGVSLIFVALPLTQISSTVVMAEIPLALMALAAAILLGRYFDEPSWKWSLGFSVMATMAIMTKANGLALGLVPVMAVLLARRFDLVKRLDFWIPGLLTATLCAPWYWATLDMLKNGPLAREPNWNYTLRSVDTSTQHLIEALGLVLAGVALIGFTDRFVIPVVRRRVKGLWLALGTLLMSVLIFHWIVPADFDPRHMLLAIPSAICFLGAGVARLTRSLPASRFSQTEKSLIAVVAIGVLFSIQTFEIPGREWRGLGPVAADLLNRSELQDSIFLISSDPSGEGAFVSEVARRESRPGHVILRASKVLARSTWSGRRYKPLYSDTESLWRYLQRIPVGVVVLDTSTPESYLAADHLLLRDTLTNFREHWELLGSYPIIRYGTLSAEAIEVYVQKDHIGRKAGKIAIDLTEMLGRKIERASDQKKQGRDDP